MIQTIEHSPIIVRAPGMRRSADRAGRRAALSALVLTLAIALLPGTAIAQEGERGQPRMQEPLTALPADTTEQTGIEAPPGSEIWAEARIITTYSLNEHLNPFDITVDVEDDTVTLSGKLDSPVERDLAVHLARELTGIDQVVDRLEIMPPGAVAPGTNPLYRSVDQANTSARVKLQLLWREPVDGLGVDVTTNGDGVVLSGTVRAEETRMLAERIARHTTGVAAVDNQLTVDPDAATAKQAGAVRTSAPEGVPDAWLTARVLASLRFDRTLDAERIDVSTQGGVVTLSGQVPTPADKREAAVVAAAIDGVRQVQNRLGVAEPGS